MTESTSTSAMWQLATSQQAATTAPKQKQKEKIIVRNLPYNLTAADFRNLIKAYIDKIDYFDYAPGKKSGQKQVPSCAWLHFTDLDTMFAFAADFDKHQFVDSRGMSVTCSVEYAQYQHYGHSLNANKTKLDTRVNTIEQDEHFIKFLADLKSPPPPPPKDEGPPMPNVHDMKTPLSTPILDELRRKAALRAQRANAQKAKREYRKKQKQAADVGDKPIKIQQRDDSSKPTATSAASKPVRGGKGGPRGGGTVKYTPRYAPKQPVVRNETSDSSSAI